MKKSIVAFLAIAILGGASYFGFQSYQASAVITELTPTVKLTSIYLDQFLALEKNPGNITFAEYFKRADEAVSELDKKLIEVKSRATKSHEELYAVTIKHIELSQQVIRGLSSHTRLRMRQDAISERADEVVLKMKTAENRYAFKYAKDDVDRVLKEMTEISEKSLESINSVFSLVTQAKHQNALITEKFGQETAVSMESADEVLKKFAPPKKDKPA